MALLIPRGVKLHCELCDSGNCSAFKTGDEFEPCFCTCHVDAPDLVTDFWGPAISIYTRRQAIDDGVLIDLGIYQVNGITVARQAHIVYPVAVTAGVYSQCIFGAFADERDSFKMVSVRAAVFCYLLAQRIRESSNGDRIYFQAPDLLSDKRAAVCNVWAKCHPGDQGENVITVMLEGED